MSATAPGPHEGNEGSRSSSWDAWLPSVLACLLAAAAAAPLLAQPGFLSTRGIGDSPNLLFRVHQLIASLAAGEFPARWMPDAVYGYGMPYFTYYASAPAHLAALLKAVGLSYVLAIKAAQALALAAGAAGMLAWLRAAGWRLAPAGLAAAAYTFAPYHLVNIYIRGDSLAELWAMGLFPLCLWAAQRLLLRPSAGRAAGLAGLAASLICTHNISALTFMPFLGLYLALGAWRQPPGPAGRLRSLWLPAGAALIWALALSAFFWLPALAEGPAVQLGGLTSGYFSYTNHFRGLDLLQAAPVFDYDYRPFSLGLIQAGLAAAGLAAGLWRAVRRRRWGWLETFLLLGLALSTWLITPLSRPVWDAVPLLAFTQFPWRFLSIQAVFLAALSGWLLGDWAGRPALAAALASAAGLVLALSGLLGLRLDFIPLTDADVTAERLNLYEYFTTAVGNTVNAEYLPQAVAPRPFTSSALLGRTPAPKALSGAAEGERLWRRGASEAWRIRVAGAEPAAVAVPTYFWPGWSAVVDGQPAGVRAAPGLGWLTLDLGPGEHQVELRLGHTPLRLAAEGLSLLAVLGPLALVVGRRRAALSRDRLRALARPVLQAAAAAALGLAVVRVIPAAAPSSGPLSMDFDTLAYPHAAPVRFANGAALLDAAYSASRLQPGETFTITTAWQSPGPATAAFRLAVPVAAFAAPLPAAVVQLSPSDQGPAVAALTVPADLTPGLYFVTVQVADSSGDRAAVTESGRGRGRIFLAPLQVDAPAGPAAAERPAADLGALRVLTAEVGLEAAGTALARIVWQAPAALTRDYQVAVRLVDPAGFEWGRAPDRQPAAGLYPTSLWRPGEAVADYVRLQLAGPGQPPGAYQLVVTPYAVDGLQPLGEARLAVNLAARTPRAGHQLNAALTEGLGLERVDFPAEAVQGEAVPITAHWLTGPDPLPAYQARWTLTPADGSAAAGWVRPLAASAAPDAWPLDAYLQGRAGLDLPNDLAPGEYTLAVQLLDPAGQPVGTPARLGPLTVAGRPRSFAVPASATRLEATFGGQLKLWGYDSERSGSRLSLHLVWSALAAPGGDFKYFVHVFNPADESIVAQADGRPRAEAYPTRLWAAGEVVTDTVSLDLAGLAAGEYSVAVGWYDPAAADLARLPAYDAAGARWPADRVILPLTIRAP